MFHHIRVAAARLARQLVPARGAHRRSPATQLLHPARPDRPLRSRPPSAYTSPDDEPLVRPYVLNAEERARRRHETLLSAAATAP